MDLVPVSFPAVVELPPVAVGPFFRHVVRSVHGAAGEIQEKRLVGGRLLGIADETDGLIRQVFGEVVAFFRRFGRFDRVIVVDQVRVILVGIAAQEAVIPLEAPSQRPAVIGPGGADLLRRGEMPFAHREGVVALALENLRQEAVFEGNDAVRARIAHGALGDAGHPVGMVVAPGQKTGPGRRAQRRRVHIAVAKAVRRQPVEVRRPDWRTVTSELAVTGVVQHDEQHVRRSRFRPQRLRPCG